ncbi:MAG: cytochrome P450, partial [Acidobacteriota bacterium]
MPTLPAPPEPPLSPFRQTLRFAKDPFAFLADTRAQCGEIFALNILGMGRCVFLCRVEHLSELYRMPEEKVVAGEIRKRLLAYLFGPRASISLDGEEYAQRRRTIQPFFSGRRVLQHTGLIVQQTQDRIAGFPVDQPFALQPHLNQVSLYVASRILFGPLDQEPAQQIVPLAGDFLSALQPPAVQNKLLQWNLPWTPFGRFVGARQKLAEAVSTAVRAQQQRNHSAEEPAEDVLSALVDAKLYDDEDICRDAIVHELVALVVGGAETTGKVLAWTLHGVLSQPEVKDRLRQEIDNELGEKPIESSDLRQLPYLHAVIQEGMRFQSAGPFAGPRLTKQAIEIGDYTIPADTIIAQCLQEAGRNELFPNPEVFDPQNFLDSGVKTRDWAPFGGGSRMCTGMGLAQLELA